MNRKDLRRWREARGWTQEEAGLWFGLRATSASRTWRKWENGERGIPAPLAKAIKRHTDGRSPTAKETAS